MGPLWGTTSIPRDVTRRSIRPVAHVGPLGKTLRVGPLWGRHSLWDPSGEDTPYGTPLGKTLPMGPLWGKTLRVGPFWGKNTP
jgi:hypothetical protein